MGQNAISLVLPQTPGKKEQISSTERMQTLCVLLGAKQTITLLSATLEQSTQSCFSSQYYDAVRVLIIDPMHNLLLGLAKTTLQVWKEKELIKDKHFDLLQRRVDAVIHRQKLERSLQRFPQDSVNLQQTSGRTGFLTIQHLH